MHSRYDTDEAVGMLLFARLILGFHLLLRSPIQQLGLGMAAAKAAQLAPKLGIFSLTIYNNGYSFQPGNRRYYNYGGCLGTISPVPPGTLDKLVIKLKG